MLLLHSTIRDYAWGSTDLIARLQGREPDGRPEAEMWLGAHPGDPCTAVPADRPEETGRRLDEVIAADAEDCLGPAAAEFGRLPYLMKLLAAGMPLSIQAHPTLEQARAGFAAEEAAGIPVDAPHRTYRDDNHKPEMVVALTPFAALCGFRSPEDAALSFDRLARLLTEYHDGQATPAAQAAEQLRGVLAGGDIETAFTAVLDPRAGWSTDGWVDDAVRALAASTDTTQQDYSLATAVQIAEHFPGDPGVIVSLLLNRVDLEPGQAIHLPAGNVHAYLQGLGVEIMAASDNVLRGGLTSKHIDLDELRRVVTFEALPVPETPVVQVRPGLRSYRPPFPEFRLDQLTLAPGEWLPVEGPGPAIAVVTHGAAVVVCGDQTARLAPGEAVFLTAAEVRDRAPEIRADDDAATVYVAALPAG